MEFLNLKLSVTEEQDPGEFLIIADSSTGGSTQPQISKLPFFKDAKHWRTTIIKALGAIEYKPQDFPSINEREWMKKVGLLEKDTPTFSSGMLEIIGRAIYEALFPHGEIRQLLTTMLGIAGNNRESLHIQFEFSKDIPYTNRIPDYPWELACDEDGFLADRTITFSRDIASLDAQSELPPVDQIRVLLLSSSAYDISQGLGKLDGQEQSAVLSGLNSAQKESRVHVTNLREQKNCVTFKAFRDYLYDHLDASAPHIIHFDGHGFFGRRCDYCRRPYKKLHVKRCETPSCNKAFLPEDPQGYLLFESDNLEVNQADYVSAQEFGRLLQDVSRDQNADYGIRLVVASACKSGMALGSNSVFNGVAQQLIKQGIPAAIAMQYNISVKGAQTFSETFYQALSSKRSIASAMKSGQVAMGQEPKQWYRPILYLRWRDNEFGQLFNPKSNDCFIPTSKEQSRWVSLLGQRSVTGLLTGTSISILVLILRLFGLMQPVELSIYDYLLRIRPTIKAVDDRLALIEATQEDLNLQRESESWNNSPSSINDQRLKELLKLLQQEEFRPSIIVLDLYRDFDDPLTETFSEIQSQPDLDLYAVCAFPYVDDGENVDGVRPPDEAAISSNYVGFSNFELDDDEILRRHLIAMTPSPRQACQSKYSLGLQVARRYLEKEINQKIDDEDIWTSNKDLILNGNLFKRINTFAFGGYQYADTKGVQFLLNYRTSPKAIGLKSIVDGGVSFEAARQGNISPSYFKDKIVLIGRTDPTTVDKIETPYGKMPGVVVHAHMISQLISTALGEKNLIWVWPQSGEVLWILLWGVAGSSIILRVKSFWIRRLLIFSGVFVIYGIVVITMISANGWIPMLPSILTWILAGLCSPLIYEKIQSGQRRLP